MILYEPDFDVALDAQRVLVEKLHRERVSQRGITRVTGVTRPTIIR